MPRSKNKFIFIQKFRAKMKKKVYLIILLQNNYNIYIFAFCHKMFLFARNNEYSWNEF